MYYSGSLRRKLAFQVREKEKKKKAKEAKNVTILQKKSWGRDFFMLKYLESIFHKVVIPNAVVTENYQYENNCC